MATIRAQHNPLARLQPGARAQIARHMARRLNNPERPVAEEIHSALERAECDPRACQCLPPLCCSLGVEVPPVPGGGWICEVARGAVFRCARAEEDGGVGECSLCGATVVEMCVATKSNNQSTGCGMSLGLRLGWVRT